MTSLLTTHLYLLMCVRREGNAMLLFQRQRPEAYHYVGWLARLFCRTNKGLLVENQPGDPVMGLLIYLYQIYAGLAKLVLYNIG